MATIEQTLAELAVIGSGSPVHVRLLASIYGLGALTRVAARFPALVVLEGTGTAATLAFCSVIDRNLVGELLNELLSEALVEHGERA